MKRTFRHVLARLREALENLTQKELAWHAGTSTATIQAIELEKLKLSPRLAFKISEATGCDYSWLLENDLSRPPVNQNKDPYSKADLIRAQSKDIKKEMMSRLKGKMELTQAYFRLRLVWEEIVKNPDELSFFLFRLKQFVDSELRRMPALGEAHIPRESDVDIPVSEFEIVKVSSYPSLFPVTPRSFDLMESDAYECREAFKEHRAYVEKEAARLKDPETQEQRSAKWAAIADKPSLLAVPRYPAPSPSEAPARARTFRTTKPVTAKPPGQKKSRRASK